MAESGSKVPVEGQEVAPRPSQPESSGARQERSEKQVVVVPPEAVREAAEHGQGLNVEIQSITMAHSGPLPPPAMLREYDSVYPGLTKIIVEEFRAESGNRRLLQRIGQSGALAVVVSILAGGFFGWITGDWKVTLALTVPICGAVGIAQLVEFWLKLK